MRAAIFKLFSRISKRKFSSDANLMNAVFIMFFGFISICFVSSALAGHDSDKVTVIYPVGSSERTYRVPNIEYVRDHALHVHFGFPEPTGLKTLEVTPDVAELWAAVNGKKVVWNQLTVYFKEDPYDVNSADLPIPSGRSYSGGGNILLKAGTFNFGGSFTPFCSDPGIPCQAGDWVAIFRSVNIQGEGKRPRLKTTIKGGSIPFWTWGLWEIGNVQHRPAGPTVRISNLRFRENFGICLHHYDYCSAYIDGCEFVDTFPTVEEFPGVFQVAAHNYWKFSVKNSFFKTHSSAANASSETGIGYTGFAWDFYPPENGPEVSFGHAEVEIINNEVHGTLKNPEVLPSPLFGPHSGISCGELLYDPQHSKFARIESNIVEAENGLTLFNKPMAVKNNKIKVTGVEQIQPLPYPSGQAITAGTPSEDGFPPGFFALPQNNSLFQGNQIKLNDGRMGIWIIGNNNVLKDNSVQGEGDIGIFIDHLNGYVIQPTEEGVTDLLNAFAFPFLRDSAGIGNVLIGNDISHFNGATAGVLFSSMAHDNVYKGKRGVVLDALDEDANCGLAGCVNDPNCTHQPLKPLYFERQWMETGFDSDLQMPIFEYLPVSCASTQPKNNSITGFDRKICRHWGSYKPAGLSESIEKWKDEHGNRS